MSSIYLGSVFWSKATVSQNWDLAVSLAPQLDEMVQQERRQKEQKLEVLREEHRRELDFTREKHSDEVREAL